MGDVQIGEGAVILPHSVLLPGARVPAEETWGVSLPNLLIGPIC